MDRKYRVAYEYLFLASKPFEYKNDLIGALAVTILFKVYKHKKEITFDLMELKNPKIYFKNKSCHLFDVVSCAADKNKLFDVDINFPLLNECGYTIVFELATYEKYLETGSRWRPIQISEDNFNDIMKNNIVFFDIPDNKPAQIAGHVPLEVTKGGDCMPADQYGMILDEDVLSAEEKAALEAETDAENAQR